MVLVGWGSTNNGILYWVVRNTSHRLKCVSHFVFPPTCVHGMESNGGLGASALLAEAIRAAVHAGAPRRTVAATAAAVTSVLVAMCGRDGASGDASATSKPSASRRRRLKRQKKAAREAAASASQLQPDRTGAGLDGDLGRHQEEPPVPAVTEAPRPAAEQPPPTQPGPVSIACSASDPPKSRGPIGQVGGKRQSGGG